MFSRKVRSFILPILLIVLAMGLITMNRQGGDEMSLMERTLFNLSYPVQWSLSRTLKEITTFWDSYVNLTRVKMENKLLMERILELERMLSDYEELKAANERLRGLLKFKAKFRMETLAAEVIGADPSRWFQTVLIDKGSSDGVAKGMAVVASSGLVGRVIEVSRGTSKVLLITDHNSAVDALIQRTRTRGIVEGNGGTTCSLKYVSRKEDVRVGDRIITSGRGGIFPKGLVIGYVTHVEKGIQGLFQGVSVKPSVDLLRMEEVFVLIRRKGKRG